MKLLRSIYDHLIFLMHYSKKMYSILFMQFYCFDARFRKKKDRLAANAHGSLKKKKKTLLW